MGNPSIDDRVKKLEEKLAELQKKVDSVEELVKVESAWVVELKQLKEQVQKISPLKIGQKIAELEVKVNKIPSQPPKVEFSGKIDSQDFIKRLEEINQKVFFSTSQMRSELTEIRSKISSLSLSKTSGTYGAKPSDEKIDSAIQDFSRKIESFSKRISEIEDSTKLEFTPIKEKVAMMERISENSNRQLQEVKDVSKYAQRLPFMIRDFQEQIALMKNMQDEMKKIANRLEFVHNDMDQKYKIISNKIHDLPVDKIKTTSKQLVEIIDKLVFLETRLQALESSLEKSLGPRPIVLE